MQVPAHTCGNSFRAPFNNMIELLEHQAQHWHDKTVFAFLSNGETLKGELSYSKLFHNAQRIAAKLQQHSQSGDRIVLMLSPGLDYISSFFACLLADCIAVPTYPPANRRRDGAKLEGLLNNAEPSIILTSAKEHQRLSQTLEGSPWLEKIISLGEIDTTAQSSTKLKWQRPQNVNLQTIAFLQYTSGSTGKPKGVIVSHGNLLANLTTIQAGLHTDENTRCATWLPPYHDMGLIGTLLSTLFAGGTAYIMEPVAFLQQPFRWLKAISDHKITHTAAPNFAFQLAIEKISTAQRAQLDLSSWRFALTGAEPIRHQTITEFEQYFAPAGYQATATFPAYGLAECTLYATGGKPKLLSVDSEKLAQNQISPCQQTTSEANDSVQTLVGCGEIGINMGLAIVNPETHELADENTTGEIWLQGPSIAQGYWQNPRVTEQTFNAKIKHQEGSWLRTGDLGFVYQQQLYVTGRIKDLIIIRGRNLYPQDIEQCAVNAHQDLLNDGCAAFTIELNSQEQLVLVHEVSRLGMKKLDLDQTEQQIKRLVHQQFAINVHDVVFIRPATLGRTSSGKIQRRGTKTSYLNQQLSTIARKSTQAATANNEQVAAVDHTHATVTIDTITSILKQHAPQMNGRIHANTAFADLGLDSVAAISMTGDLAKQLERQIDPMLLWDYPTLGQFCDYLNGKTVLNSPTPITTSDNAEIPIIGMAVNLPKDINTLHQFWQAMIEQTPIIDSLPAARQADWPQDDYPHGGFLNQVDQFDPSFFAISSKEAQCIDPQQRLLLQTSWSALEDASINQQQVSGSATGVFIGLSTDDYAHLAKSSELFATDAGALGLGSARSVAAGRLAYFLGCHGPALAVDTACSSSAYAIHLACQSIQAGESTLALAGGANLILQSDSYQVLNSLNALSPTHSCKTFSNDADGYVRGEGCAILVLASHDYAKQHNHRVYAHIVASNTNQDGHSNGLTAPNGNAQRMLMRNTLIRSKLDNTDIGFIETHGTGTPLGDPIEVNAIASIYSQQEIKLGAIKSQFGHLEAAAGVLSVIKTALAIHHQQIPANHHFTQGNEHIHWQAHQLTPANQQSPWPQGKSAAINSFGLSGTNVHLILSPPQTVSTETETIAQQVWPMVKVSAQHQAALKTQGQNFANQLATEQQQLIGQISQSQYRSDFDWRAVAIAKDSEQLKQQLQNLKPVAVPTEIKPLVFMFTGQGAIYSQMGQQLYATAPVFAARIDDANQWLIQNHQQDLSKILFDSEYSSQLQQPEYAQLSLFVLQIALVDWLASLNITPSAVIGHSIGEFAAAYCAGVLEAQAGYQLVYQRGLLCNQCPAGAMLAVKTSLENLTHNSELPTPQQMSLDIAAVNQPKQVVLAGSPADITAYEQQLQQQQISYRRLDTTHGFHSQLMTPMMPDFEQVLNQCNFKSANIDWFSTVNSSNLKGQTIDSNYWLQHLRQTVQFNDAFNQLDKHYPQHNLIELGPQPILATLVSRIKPQQSVLSSLKAKGDNQINLAKSLTELWQRGHQLNWQGLNPLPPSVHHKLNSALPHYAFRQKRYWLDEQCINYQQDWQSLTLADVEQQQPITLVTNQVDNPIVEALSSAQLTLCSQTDVDTLQANKSQQLVWHFDNQLSPQQAILALKPLFNAGFGRIWLIVEGLHQAATHNQANSAASLWGACISLRHEFPKQFAAIIDIETELAPQHLAPLPQLLNQSQPQTSYRLTQQGLTTAKLQQVTTLNSATSFSGQSFLITGGNGALGKMLAQYLAAQGASSITLAARKPIEPQLIAALGKDHHHCQINSIQLDVCQPQQLADYFATPNLQLDGIFHLAGVAADVCPLSELSDSELDKVLAAKTQGAWDLHHYSQQLALKHFVLFSSVASLIGYAGQTAYSAANYQLDWLAQYRHSQGLPALSINFGPWQASQQGEGMAANSLVDKAMAQMGMHPLNQQQAFNNMAQALSSNLSNIAIIDMETRLFEQFSAQSDSSEQQDGNNHDWYQQVMQLPVAQRQNEIKQWLQQLMVEALGEAPDDDSFKLPLNRLGMDSIRALDIKHAIFERTAIDIPVVQFLQGISMADLAQQLASADVEQQNANQLISIKADNPAPLSDPQQRLWLVNQWQQPDGLYNIHAAIYLAGKLDIAKLQRVIDALVARHEVLRTRFLNDDDGTLGGPKQLILDEQPIAIKQHQIEHDVKSEHAHSLLRTLAHQVFDLQNGPLLSVDLITNPAQPDVAILALTLDHIIADAWSMDVLIGNVMALYQQVELPALDIQYRDYALWQQNDLSAEKLKRLGQFWQQNLADFTPFELQPDLPRPARQQLDGRCHKFVLSDNTSKALQQLAEQQGVTQFVLLLTLFKLFMHQQTGSRDIAIGTDVANREHSQTRDLIGFFVNLLMLRSQWQQNPSFEQLLQQQAQTVQQAMAHQDMPFHRLVELMNRPRDASRNPLIQILFVLQNAQSQSLTLPNLDVQTVDFDQQVCRFDMAVFFHQKDHVLEGHWHYATALYSPARIKQLADKFTLLIEQVIRAQQTNKPLSLEDIRMLETKIKSTKSKAGFNRFKSKSAAKKPVAAKPLVEKTELVSGVTMPLLVKASNPDIDPFGWAQINRDGIFADLEKHGAILFRDFGLNNAQDFERFAQTLCPSLYGDYGDLPKEKQGKKIYHSTPYPEDKAILYHNESSHMHQWPTRQFFFCVTPSPVGGATPIVDCREVYRQMDPEILAQFENKHLKYVRNFSRNLDVSWQNFFKTEDRKEVEAKCDAAGISYQWLDDDGLRTEEIRRAVTVHPQSGEKSFFNQIQLHHAAFLPQQVRESLMAIGGIENLPRHVYFGDGSEISDEIALYTLDLYERLAVRFDWQKGDLIVVDNMAVAHARDPFQGERKINVAMAEMTNQQGEIIIPPKQQ